eukprot:m.33726 g.33726  ORF g.33726 m.33726 type:complete len:289 (-) comp16862_c0_seq1:106-972(-)
MSENDHGTPLSTDLHWIDVQIDGVPTLRLCNVNSNMNPWLVTELMDAIEVARDFVLPPPAIVLQGLEQKSFIDSGDISYLIEHRAWTSKNQAQIPTVETAILPNQIVFTTTHLLQAAAKQPILDAANCKQPTVQPTTPVLEPPKEQPKSSPAKKVTPEQILTPEPLHIQFQLVDTSTSPLDDIWIELVVDLSTNPTVNDLKGLVKDNWDAYVKPKIGGNPTIQVGNFYTGTTTVNEYLLYPYVPTKTSIAPKVDLFVKDVFPSLANTGSILNIFDKDYETLKAEYFPF